MGLAWEQESVKHSLKSYLPYVHFFDNKILLNNHNLSFVLRLNCFYDDILSNAQINMYKANFENFLNVIDKNLYVQIYFKRCRYFDDIIESHLSQNEDPDNDLIKLLYKSRIDKIYSDAENYNLFRFYIYLVVTKKYQFEEKGFKNLTSSINQLTSEFNNKLNKAILDLNEIQNKYIPYLQKAGFTVKVPNKKEVLEFVAEQINQTEIKNIDYYSNQSLIHSCISKTPFYLCCSDKYLRFITFKGEKFLPQYTNPLIIKKIINAAHRFECDVIVTLSKLDLVTQKMKIERRRDRAAASRFKYGTNTPNREQNLKEEMYDAALKEIAKGNVEYFNHEMLILVKAPSLEKLKKNCEDMLSSMAEIPGTKGFLESVGNFLLYKRSWPGFNYLTNFRHFEFNTKTVSNLAPVLGPSDGSKQPLMLLRNKWNGITSVNPISKTYKNKNGIVIGSSGVGKSFFVNQIFINYLPKKPYLMVVEIGDSFKKFVTQHGGTYFEIGLQNTVNFFEIITDDEDVKEMFWQSTIEVMIKEKGQEGLTNDDKIVIQEAIHKVIAKKIENPIASDFVDALKECDFKSPVLRETQDRIARHLDRWTKGKLGAFCNNRKSDISIEGQIIGFNLQGLDNTELLEPFMFYLSNLCSFRLQKYKGLEQAIIFDEAWKLFLSEQGAKLIEELYRTIRKTGSALISISQGIGEFAESNFRNAILQNISILYVLEQAPGTDFKMLKEVLNLTDHEKNLIERLKTIPGHYSEVFLRTPDFSSIIRMVPSPIEYWLATTNADDIKVFNKTLKEKNDNLVEALKYLAERYPNGAFKSK